MVRCLHTRARLHGDLSVLGFFFCLLLASVYMHVIVNKSPDTHSRVSQDQMHVVHLFACLTRVRLGDVLDRGGHVCVIYCASR